MWNGIFYAALLTLCFILFRIGVLFHTIPVAREVIPGYWNPHTLFNLGQITRGYSIEDILYMFFVGGMAACVYEIFFNKRIKFKKKPEAHFRAIKVAGLAAFLVGAFTHLNMIYALIVFGYAGALAIWNERKDLIMHSLVGGLVLTAICMSGFFIFNFISPNFVNEFYNLRNTSGLLVLGVPLEEYLYLFGFGLMWAPFYEYEHGEKDIVFKKIQS